MDFRCETCEDSKYCWTSLENGNAFIRDATHRLDMRIWVQFIYGYIKSVDKVNRVIHSTDNCNYHYDVFLLMSHKKHGLPLHLRPKSMPYNLAQINYRLDRIQLYFKVKLLVQSPNAADYRFVVYGANIAPFECLNFLLKHGIEASQITLVVPYTKKTELHDKYNLAHSDITYEYKMQTLAENLGIKVKDNYNLVELIYHKSKNFIAAVVFEHFFTKERLTIQTDLFINYNCINLDERTAYVCKSAGLKTQDEYILVNENFQTSDPHIYAVGDYIKHIKEPNHQYRWVAPRELAEKLMVILKIGFVREHTSVIRHKFYYNHYYHGKILKDMLFVKVVNPKRYLKNQPTNEYTLPLRTATDYATCRVRLDREGMVEEILLVTSKMRNYDFLQFFCGKHQSLLNDLRGRYCFGEIPCFLEFFIQPWTELLAHDYFPYEIHGPINDILIEYLRKNFDFKVSRCDRLKQLERDIPPSRLEQIVLAFLRRYRYDFDYSFALPEDFPTESFIGD